MAFPSSPSNGTQATVNGITYVYNSTKTAWIRNSTTGANLTANSLSITGTTVAVSPTSGALIVAGGAGVAGNLYVGGALYGNVVGIVNTTTLSLTTLTASTVTASSGITGTLQTASQPNITAVGTLGSLTVSGNVTAGNITTTGTVNATTLIGAISSSQVTSALGYTPYNGTSNPNGYLSTAVTSATGGTGVSVSASTGSVTFSIGQAVATTSNPQFNSLGIGTAASTNAGEIRATASITAYYSSDKRLKENIVNIVNPLAKLQQLNGVEYDWTDKYIADHGGEDGYFVRKHDVGLIAQEVEAVLPEIVAENNEGYKAIKYERVVALLVEAVKELSAEVARLKGN